MQKHVTTDIPNTKTQNAMPTDTHISTIVFNITAMITWFIGITVNGLLFFLDYISDQKIPSNISKIPMIVHDYYNIWFGQYTLHHEGTKAIFDPIIYKNLAVKFNNIDVLYTWSYPPSILLLTTPFGWLSPLCGMIIYSLFGISLGIYILKKYKLPTPYIAAAILSPASIICLQSGQNGWYTTALFLAAISASTPAGRGISAAILSCKPQIGILLPIIYMIQRQWKTIIYTIIFTTTLIGATIACYGIGVWNDFFHKTSPFMREIMEEIYQPHEHKMYFYMATTPYSFLKWAGMHTQQALYMQIPISIIVLGINIYQWSPKRINTTIGKHIAVATSLISISLITPYSFTYDTIPAMISILIILTQRHTLRTPTWIYPLYIIGWISPPISTIISLFNYMPIEPLGNICVLTAITIQAYIYQQHPSTTEI